MQIYYVLSFTIEGVDKKEIDEIRYSLLAGLIKGAVTSEFFYQLPSVVSFISGQNPDTISSILDRINDEIFPPERTLRYFLSEINPATIRVNVNEEEASGFKKEMSRR